MEVEGGVWSGQGWIVSRWNSMSRCVGRVGEMEVRVKNCEVRWMIMIAPCE